MGKGYSRKHFPYCKPMFVLLLVPVAFFLAVAIALNWLVRKPGMIVLVTLVYVFFWVVIPWLDGTLYGPK